jgi:predicted dehydrogenase
MSPKTEQTQELATLIGRDIEAAALLFKVRKVLRYVRLYGPSPTFAKIKREYHLRRSQEFDGTVWTNPKCRLPEHSDRFVAMVGCGGFPYSSIAYYLRALSPNFLRATYDLLPARARSLCADYSGAYASRDFESILADDKVKLVYIASNHATHAEYAIEALDAGKHVHIEKPHVISEDQLDRLMDAQARNPDGMVFLGFNRPQSALFRRAADALASQTGPLMTNWFIAGHKIADDHWYFSDAEGGRILGNVCHWTDSTLQLVGLENAFPCEISAASPPNARSDFAISMVFADGSVAAITFSAKGHTFDGVREVLNAHRGDALLTMSDFHTLKIDVGPSRHKYRRLYRDHGHRSNIGRSFEAVRDNDRSKAVSKAYSEATARLFLAVKEAIDRRAPIILAADGPIGARGDDGKQPRRAAAALAPRLAPHPLRM